MIVPPDITEDEVIEPHPILEGDTSDPVPNPDLSLSEKHKQIAYMEVSGLRFVDIAERIGLTFGRISTLRKEPAYKVFISELSKEVRNSSKDSIAEMIEKESTNTVNTIFELRDTARNETVRLKAATELFDRNLPKIHKSELDSTTILSFESKALDTIANAIIEARDKALPQHLTDRDEILKFLEEDLKDESPG